MEEKKTVTISDLLDEIVTDDASDEVIQKLGVIKQKVTDLEDERDNALEKYHETRQKYIHAIQNGDFGVSDPEKSDTDDEGPVTIQELIDKYSKE